MSTLIENHYRVNTKFDPWSSKIPIPPAYVHPLMPATYPFRTTRVLNQRSLDMCTESLGSETGSDGYSDIDDCFEDAAVAAAVIVPRHHDTLDTNGEVLEETDRYYDSKPSREKKELPQVNYHCSIGQTSKVRSFPPPLPSISRRDGVCINMKPHRRDGNLIIEAVPVPSQNYLHCHRHNGRLLLSFVNTTFEDIYPKFQVDPSSDGQKQSSPDFINYEQEEVEDQVEVVDRGILVEVKVSRQAQFQRKGTKVRKSSLVINKFVSGIPLVPININLNFNLNLDLNLNPAVDGWGWRQDENENNEKQLENNNSCNKKILFTTKKLINRQALLHQVRTCSYHHRPLFIWERCCIATS